MASNIEEINGLKGSSALSVIKKAEELFGKRLAFVSSLGAEDQAILDIIASAGLKIDIITIDTGRLFKETYDVLADSEKRYGVKFKVFFPDAAEVENMLASESINLFYESVPKRKLCCEIRKIHPLRRALENYDAWICGLRKAQSENRHELPLAETEPVFGKIKIAPLADWSDEYLAAYLKERDIPVNVLHEKGYPSIGCAPCTREVAPGEHPRAGRWYWEQTGKKECGLHWENGKIVRNNN